MNRRLPIVVKPLDLDALEPDWIRQACLDFAPVASRAEKVLRLIRELRAAREVVEAAWRWQESWGLSPDTPMGRALVSYDAAVSDKSPNPEAEAEHQHDG